MQNNLGLATVIAAVCHEVNRAYCLSALGDTQQEWNDAPDWQKQSAIEGVKAALANPELTAEQSHNNWLNHKRSEGWTWGAYKDPEKKKHPSMLPYYDLPATERVKDSLFIAVARSMKKYFEHFEKASDEAAYTDEQIEAEIQEKGLTAPRVELDKLKDLIVKEEFTVLPSGRTTVCELTLRNGFTVRGDSSVVSRENFNEELGRKISRQKARDQVWPLEAYLLTQRLHEERTHIPQEAQEQQGDGADDARRYEARQPVDHEAEAKPVEHEANLTLADQHELNKRDVALRFEALRKVIESVGSSRALSLALTNLDNARLWVNEHFADVMSRLPKPPG